jgi:hypothetical protein
MWQTIKIYLAQTALSKYLPMGVMAGLSTLGFFMAAHAGLLEKYGITYGAWPFQWSPNQSPTGPCILIELDTFSTSAITLLASLFAIVLRAIQHHTTGTPVAPPPTIAAPPVKNV